MDQKILFEKAKKHKKWLDNKVTINPMGYEVNKTDYYLAIYKRNAKLKGYTVISEGNYSEEDAIIAFERLVLYTVFANKFFEIEKAKMKLSPTVFYSTAELISEYVNTNQKSIQLLKGREILIELGNLLSELQEYMKNYIKHYDNHILKTNKIDDQEYEYLLETLSHINRMQYLQGRKFLDSFADLKSMQQEMSKLKIEEHQTREHKIILQELLNGTKETEQSIKSLNIEKEIVHLPVEEQIKILVEEFKKVGRKKLPRYKQDLRYPKP
jgi:hypothetical protein